MKNLSDEQLAAMRQHVTEQPRASGDFSSSEVTALLDYIDWLRMQLRHRECEIDAVAANCETYRQAWKEAKRHLLNLLARIHQDGGHYTERNGLEKSVADADAKCAKLNASVCKACKGSNRIVVDTRGNSIACPCEGN